MHDADKEQVLMKKSERREYGSFSLSCHRAIPSTRAVNRQTVIDMDHIAKQQSCGSNE